MNTHSGTNDNLERYRDNFSRHVLSVARDLQTRMMNTLQEECNHHNLRLGFAPYITLLGQGGLRLMDLSQALGISRQACNQAANQIEIAGYLCRSVDPRDGRAKQLILTDEGVRLRQDGIKIAARLDQELAEIVGGAALLDAAKSLAKLHRKLALELPREEQLESSTAYLSGLLPRLADYMLQRLMELTIDKGHPGLKLSFGQVLTLIGPAGGRIREIAAIQDVSKQAISVIAGELEVLGYLRREAAPHDARQLVLRFTESGLALISDSVASVDELEQEFGTMLGKTALRRLQATLRSLYSSLQLEQDIFEGVAPSRIQQLARQLQEQLGASGSQALARALLNQNTGVLEQ